jgi:hypothetical protein
MSGGSFRYAYNHVEQFVEELHNKIDDNDKPNEWGDGFGFSPEVLVKLQEVVDIATLSAKLMKEVEWLYSGDTVEDTFLERVAKIGGVHLGWQPIDTAPKDRSDVWLFCPIEEPHQCVGFFSDGDGGYWEPSEKLVADVLFELNPTHWMPLPDAPKE